MKTIIKMVTVLLIAVTFMNCGTSSYLEVRERPTSPYYYERPIRHGYWRAPYSHRRYYYSPGYWQPAPRGGYYRHRGRRHR